MQAGSHSVLAFLILFVIVIQSYASIGGSTAVQPDLINYGQDAKSLTSEKGTFVAGFFDRGSSTYLGIWHATKDDNKVIVWVGNRDTPMPLSSYSIRISNDGKATVFDSTNRSYWSTNYSTKPSSTWSMVLQLHDNGNLILEDRGRKEMVLWQSFDSPTDTFLPGMDMNNVNITGLVAWKTPQDPAQGDYSFQKDSYSPALLIYNTSHQTSTPYWNSSLSFVYPNLAFLLNNSASVVWNESSTLIRLVMSSNGFVQLWELNQESNKKWENVWEAPKDHCDLFELCGDYGVCDAGNSIRCKCLPGYNPNDPEKWLNQDFSSGCSKTTNNQCGGVLISLPMVKLPPDNIVTDDTNEINCKNGCLQKCDCKAYSFNSNG